VVEEKSQGELENTFVKYRHLPFVNITEQFFLHFYVIWMSVCVLYVCCESMIGDAFCRSVFDFYGEGL
jgi:hypothetical protein